MKTDSEYARTIAAYGYPCDSSELKARLTFRLRERKVKWSAKGRACWLQIIRKEG